MKQSIKALAAGGLGASLVAAPLLGTAASASAADLPDPVITSVTSDGEDVPISGFPQSARIHNGHAMIAGTVETPESLDQLLLRGPGNDTLCTDVELERIGERLHFACEVAVPAGRTDVYAVAERGGEQLQATFPLVLTSEGSGVEVPAAGSEPTSRVLAQYRSSAHVVLGGGPFGKYEVLDSRGVAAIAPGRLNGSGESDARLLPAGTWTVRVDDTVEGGSVQETRFTIRNGGVNAPADPQPEPTPDPVDPAPNPDPLPGPGNEPAATVEEQFDTASVVRISGWVGAWYRASSSDHDSRRVGQLDEHGQATETLPVGNWQVEVFKDLNSTAITVPLRISAGTVARTDIHVESIEQYSWGARVRFTGPKSGQVIPILTGGPSQNTIPLDKNGIGEADLGAGSYKAVFQDLFTGVWTERTFTVDTATPPASITAPKVELGEQMGFGRAKVDITGTALKHSQFEITVNGVKSSESASDGSTQLFIKDLKPGENTITVKQTMFSTHSTQTTLTITRR